MDQLTIKLFGSFEVLYGGKPLTDFATVKTRALLAYLAMEAPTAHSRDQLADLLWPESPTDLAKQSLRQTLSYLKRGMEGYSGLTIDRGSVALALGADDSVDVTAFADLLATCQEHRHRDILGCRPCIGRLETAAALVRGPFLADVYTNDSATFEEWATLKREWARRLATTTFRRLCEVHERRGVVARALELAWRLSESAPWDETAHRTLLRLLAVAGQRNVALAHHRRFSTTLADELGVAPTDETEALVTQIRLGQLPCRARPRVTLPASGTPFVGRRAELQAISAHLANPDCRLLTVVGPGGIGKTRLALRAAEEQVGAFRDGLFWVPLTACRSAEEVATAIAAALDYTFDARGDPSAQVRDYLRRKALLLVLDNFEQVLAARELVAEILRYAPEVVMLVTSRERLNLREEWIVALDGLPVAGATGDATASGDGALALFWACAARAGYGVASAGAADAAAAIRICRLVNGAPLGIELAASSLQSTTVTAVADQIAESLDAVVGRYHNVPSRHRSLRASFEHSWALLGAPEQAAFSALSVFAGTFGGDPAQRVAGASPELLQRLADKSLIQRANDGQLAIHPLLQQYAGEQLRQDPQRARVLRDRHAATYLGLLTEDGRGLGRAMRPTALVALQREIGNIRAAWAWAVEQRHWPTLAQAADGLADYHLLRGPVQDGAALLEAALAAAKGAAGVPVSATITLQLALARLRNAMGAYDAAIAAARAALADIDDPEGADCMPCTSAHLAWGHALQLMGTYDEAAAHLTTALTLAQVHDLPDLEGAGWLYLARVDLGQGQIDAALTHGHKALTLSQRAGHLQTEADSLAAIGTTYYFRKEHAQARTYFDRALARLQEVGDLHREARLQNNVGNCLAESGDYTAATRYYNAALVVHRKTGRRRAEGIVLNNLAALAWSQGDLIAAWQLYDDALTIAREIQDREGEALVRSNMSLVTLLGGDAQRAAALAREALPLARELGDRYTEGQTLMRLGLALTACDRFDAAEAALSAALGIHQSLETTPLVLEAEGALAHYWLRRGQVDRAMGHVEAILATLAEDAGALHGADEPFRVLWACVMVLQEAGDPRAQAVLAAAAAQLRAQAAAIEDPVLRASFLENLAVHRELRKASTDYADFAD